LAWHKTVICAGHRRRRLPLRAGGEVRQRAIDQGPLQMHRRGKNRRKFDPSEMDNVRYFGMRKVFLIGSITMLMTGCVAPFPPLPGYGVAGGGPPQEYYDDGPYYGNRPYYGGPYYGNRPYYVNRPYYSGRRSYYRSNPYSGRNYYRDEDDRDRNHHDKDRKDKKDKKHKKHHDGDKKHHDRDKKHHDDD
jgi:hypothetical protein